MRRIGTVGALAVVVVLPLGGSDRPLPLHPPQASGATALAMLAQPGGSRLAEVDPKTLAVLRSSSKVGFAGGWARSPAGGLVAVVTERGGSMQSATLRFADVKTLNWAPKGISLHGFLKTTLWTTPRTLLAVVGTPWVLHTIDTSAKTIVSTKPIDGNVIASARSAEGLVLLTAPESAIGPVRLVTVQHDGSMRSTQLERIRGGTVWNGTDHTGTRREPGLAVDPAGTAYVVDPDGLVGQVTLADLSVEYHRVAGSLLARASAWLTPSAAAKGLNGPTRTATWLGDGLIAVTGNDESAVRKDADMVVDIQPAGLKVIDVRDWSTRTLDPRASSATVAEGALLVTGGSYHYERTSLSRPAGVAAYGSDGRLRWRIGDGTNRWIAALYGSLVALGGGQTPKSYNLVDVQTGKVVRSVDASRIVYPLVGPGS
jgi:hypothetical protein